MFGYCRYFLKGRPPQLCRTNNRSKSDLIYIWNVQHNSQFAFGAIQMSEDLTTKKNTPKFSAAFAFCWKSQQKKISQLVVVRYFFCLNFSFVFTHILLPVFILSQLFFSIIASSISITACYQSGQFVFDWLECKL